MIDILAMAGPKNVFWSQTLIGLPVEITIREGRAFIQKFLALISFDLVSLSPA